MTRTNTDGTQTSTDGRLAFESLRWPADRRMLTVHEVAERLRVTVVHVKDLIEEGALQAVNVGGAGRKHWRIPVEAWDKFVGERHSWS